MVTTWRGIELHQILEGEDCFTYRGSKGPIFISVTKAGNAESAFGRVVIGSGPHGALLLSPMRGHKTVTGVLEDLGEQLDTIRDFLLPMVAPPEFEPRVPEPIGKPRKAI